MVASQSAAEEMKKRLFEYQIAWFLGVGVGVDEEGVIYFLSCWEVISENFADGL